MTQVLCLEQNGISDAYNDTQRSSFTAEDALTLHALQLSVTLSLTTRFDPSDLDCLSPFRVQMSVSAYNTVITHFTIHASGLLH